MRFARLLMVSGFILWPAAAPAQSRLLGLDRLHFERVPQVGDRLAVPAHVAALLPRVLESSAPPPDTMDLMTAQDFDVGVQRSGRAIRIRAVMPPDHQRAQETWWALYVEGRRSEVWRYRADGEQAGRAVGNYRLVAVLAPASGGVVLRVDNSMQRQGGLWWVTGKEVVLGVRGDALEFRRVRHAFGLFHGPDGEDSDGTLSVRTEVVDGTRFVTREVDPVPVDRGIACGLGASEQRFGVERFDWERLERAARCLVGREAPVAGTRRLDEPSFIERPPSAR